MVINDDEDGASSIKVTIRVRPFTIREAAQLVKTDNKPVFLGDGSLISSQPKLSSSKGLRSIIKVIDDKCLVFDPPEDNPVTKYSKNLFSSTSVASGTGTSGTSGTIASSSSSSFISSNGPQGKRVKDQTFMFDKIFDENTTQNDVYESTTKNLLNSVLNGYNATVFAYGATGCGKTHTITGTSQQPGIIFLTMQELFEKISELSSEKLIEVSLSYLEIYNETIRDLLEPAISSLNNKQGLSLREDSNQTVTVTGLSNHFPKNVQEVMDMIIKGNENRTISPTEANATSSRSHAVLQINISQKDRNSSINEPHTMATLSIIDLAGSERASVTKNRGERLLEGANINKSLLSLGSCINALCDPRKRNHIPYRNSKLTRLLKFSLGGNCKTVMIVCISPSSFHFDETQNTLRYANRAKNIQTKVTRNVYNVNRHVKDFLKKIDEQMILINELKQQQKDYEKVAFIKFKKHCEKKEAILKEGIIRIKSSYENSLPERQERLNMTKKLRQIEKRISLISSWLNSFDTICEQRQDEETSNSLLSMKQTANGILTELESSRHHYYSKLSKSNWDRSIESALQHSIRQIQEIDPLDSEINPNSSNNMIDSIEVSSLRKEKEMLINIADRELYHACFEQEKIGDTSLMEILLQAHFDTILILETIRSLSEEDAIQQAKNLIGKIINSCTLATSRVIKPDGLLSTMEKSNLNIKNLKGTPKQGRKLENVNIKPPSPIKSFILESISAGAVDNGFASTLKPSLNSIYSSPIIQSLKFQSPIKNSPRRKKLGTKKTISLTPKNKKSPGKKRVVRWKDDTDDGLLVEYQTTPKTNYSTPEFSSDSSKIDHSLLTPPNFNISQDSDTNVDNAHHNLNITLTSKLSDQIKSKSARFQEGFLLKKDNMNHNHNHVGSPGPAPTSSLLNSSDSEISEISPLREIHFNKIPSNMSMSKIPSPLSKMMNTENNINNELSPSYNSTPENGSGNVSESDQSNFSGDDKISLSKDDTSKIKSVLKRRSSVTNRRRSPTLSSSPPQQSDSKFSSGKTKRMGNNVPVVGTTNNVLSPRVAAVTKVQGQGGIRRTTVNDDSRSNSNGLRSNGPIRGNIIRNSLAPGIKNTWR